MNASEIAAFERNPNLDAIITVRYLDEAGKIAGMETPDFQHLAPKVQRLVDTHAAGLRGLEQGKAVGV